MTAKSLADSSQGDSAAVTPVVDGSCISTEDFIIPREQFHRELSIQSTEKSTERCKSQQTEDAAATAARETVVAVPKKPAWGLSSISTDAASISTVNKKEETAPALSFADIMSDQSRDRAAARLAYSDNIVDETFSLTEIETQQKRLFASLASKDKHQPLLGSDSKDNISIVDPTLSGIDDKERKMIELAMKQSLAECNNITSNKKDDLGIFATTKDMAAACLVATTATETSEEEAEREMIEAAIREADAKEQQNADTTAIDAKPAAMTTKSNLEDIEKEMIEAAIRMADAKERADAEAESLMLVMKLQHEEVAKARQRQQQHQQHTTMSTGSVRTMTRAALAAETYADQNPVMQYDDGEYDEISETGFRMNQQNQHQISGWYRRDRNTIVGPDNEIRTKHDVKVQGQANASYLDLDVVDDDTGLRTHVGNTAFNSFRKTVAGSYHAKGGHRGMSKGVANFGTGRAGSDADATKGGALDQQVRLHISKAINAGIIERCNGIVKQGKEAVVYHAVGGISSNQTTPNDSNNISEESTTNDPTKGKVAKQKDNISISDNNGFDVAIKVFKRIKEFKGRGEYVDGDPRYAGRPFRSFTEREQLQVWTEKEYRNLVRAYRAEIPVPNPIHYKDNLIFMRFLGQDGWPAPQIREINIRKDSSKWTALYEQVMGSVKKLFQDARLVHGDLSEYNILIASNFQVDHKSENIGSKEDLQTVLIDFGQAVEVRHPKAEELLKRDLARVKEFFAKQGVTTTMALEDATQFVIGDYSFSIILNDTKIPGI